MKKFSSNQIKTFAVDIIYDIIGGMLYAAGIYTFASTANFSPGGISGLALIINHLWKLPIGLCTLLLNVPIIIICIKTLGKRFFLRSIKTMAISALIMDFVFPLLPTYSGNQLLAALFAGLLSGAGLAFVYMRDSSTGGTDFLIMSVRKKYPHMSIGSISLIIDGVVILLGGVVYGGVDAVLYGIVMTIGYTIVVDKIMYGADSRKMSMIISDHSDEIARRIGFEIERGVTMLKGTGTYTGAERRMLMCICTKAELYKIKRLTYSIDPNAIVMFIPLDAAYGEGFIGLED